VATCSLRISNPYGPHQDRPDHAFGVVGTFLSRAAAGEDITLYGGGGQLRDYIYIDDLVELLVLAVTHPAAVGRVYNAGGPRGVMLREMAETVVSTVGRGRVVDVPWDPAAASVETGDYVSDCSRVTAELGWAPETDLTDGLREVWGALQPQLEARA
jgi:UDP-glucose 4-epimerase